MLQSLIALSCCRLEVVTGTPIAKNSFCPDQSGNCWDSMNHNPLPPRVGM